MWDATFARLTPPTATSVEGQFCSSLEGDPGGSCYILDSDPINQYEWYGQHQVVLLNVASALMFTCGVCPDWTHRVYGQAVNKRMGFMSQEAWGRVQRVVIIG